MATGEREIRACAKSIVQTSNLKRGDAVIVRGGVHSMSLLEEVALECYRKGAIPSIIVTSDSLAKRVYDEIPASTLSTVPKHYVAMVRECDMIISIEDLDDPSIAERFPRRKIQARQKASLPILELLTDAKDGKKWLYAGWPTRAAARRYGISLADLEKIIIGGISVSPKELMAIGKKLHDKFDSSAWVHVWDDKGTDFEVKVQGRRWNIDDGFTSQEDYDAGDRGANLPAGELFTAPHETLGSGTLYSPITVDRVSDKLIRDVHLEFENGRLLLDKVTASSNLDALVSSFRECEQLDKTKFDPVRTMNVAELGIGFNPSIKKSIGYILTDEKVNGTVHVAFGMNKGYGGKSLSTMHWDFVSAPGVSIEAVGADGRTVEVMRKGRFL